MIGAELVQGAVVGIITGLFSAGTVWGVLRTEMRYLRRDVDRLHRKVFGSGTEPGTL